MKTNISIFKKSFRSATMGVAVAALTAFSVGQAYAAEESGASKGATVTARQGTGIAVGKPGASQGATVTAQQGTSVAILDVNRIIAEAKAAKAVNVQMKNFQEKIQAEIKKQEESLRTLNNQLVKEEKTLDPKAFEKKRAAFEAKVTELQRIVMERNTALQQAAQTSMEKVRGSVVKISDKIRIARGFSIVLPSSFPVTYHKGLDITNEVIAELNKQLPTVKVQIAKAKAPTIAKAPNKATTGKTAKAAAAA